MRIHLAVASAGFFYEILLGKAAIHLAWSPDSLSPFSWVTRPGPRISTDASHAKTNILRTRVSHSPCSPCLGQPCRHMLFIVILRITICAPYLHPQAENSTLSRAAPTVSHRRTLAGNMNQKAGPPSSDAEPLLGLFPSCCSPSIQLVFIVFAFAIFGSRVP
ncbi:hypothetical protein V8C42DRAFT_140408 [Trichoderma barbatum]